MGIMLWEEIPVYWAIDFENKATFADAKNQLSELVRRDKNRASVIIWSVGNENPDTDARLSFMKGLADTAREVDGTRPISAACLVDHERNRIADRLADHLDIIGINEYIGWYSPDFSLLPDLFENSKVEKPVIISEFGGGALAGHHGSEDELFTEENQRAIYRKQIETFKKIPYIAGTSPWILFDFRTPKRANRFQEGYNRKGLFTADKKYKKLAFYEMQKFYSEIAENID
jgi:beta-glucuronidase